MNRVQFSQTNLAEMMDKSSHSDGDPMIGVGLTLGQSESSEQEEEATDTTSSCASASSLTPDNPIYIRHQIPINDREDTIQYPIHSLPSMGHQQQQPIPHQSRKGTLAFHPHYVSTRLLQRLSSVVLMHNYSIHDNATWIGFWALLSITCANYVLTPMRDAVALAVGVGNLPRLTLASTVLAFISSVPIGWLFEAPDPKRRKLWRRVGLTRGETQGTSLALFYRFFMGSILSYALGFFAFRQNEDQSEQKIEALTGIWSVLQQVGSFMYIAFFLVVHLMKLHSLSLVWGVTTEAMEYEDLARKKHNIQSKKTRLQRLAFIGFGGTLGGILGSVIASSMAHILKLSGLLVVSALLLELSAELSIEMGRVMQKHWNDQQLMIQSSCDNLSSLDTSMRRSTSMGSMKRVASGNSLHKVRSLEELNHLGSPKRGVGAEKKSSFDEPVDDNTFTQRLMRGITTILRSRLLMSIFTYNALYASTTVLLSFQRAALVAARNVTSSKESDTAFLANINMASSVATFALQASGLGALLATKVGSRGTLSLMPLIRLAGVLGMAWWHRTSQGAPPNLILFLLLDECTRVMNMAVAKPVRESLWRGLSNEARYESKPIVDTLANRWGGGSAAFLVSFSVKMLDTFGIGKEQEDGSRTVFGYPPIICLCLVIAAWWTMVSVDLGRIRSRIDMELKKHQ